MEYRSSFLLTVRGCLIYILAVFGIVMFAGAIVIKFIYFPFGSVKWLAMAGATLMALYMGASNWTKVILKENEMIIKTNFKKNRVIPYEGYTVSTRVCRHSVNFIPVETERILVMYKDGQEFEILLHNFSKKSFDLVAAFLQKKTIQNEMNHTVGVGRESFNIPKDEMINDHFKIIKIYTTITLLASVGVTLLLQYKLRQNSYSYNPVKMFLLIGMNFLFPGLAIFLYHNWKKKHMPSSIIINERNITIDEKIYHMRDIKRIIMTPPDYTKGNMKDGRNMVIEGSEGKKKYYFGVRTLGGIYKTIFDDYGGLCDILRKVALANDVDFTFDL